MSTAAPAVDERIARTPLLPRLLARPELGAVIGAVLVFVPGLVVLYLFLTLLEDSGYMARVAFVMDRLMRFTGLHGKSLEESKKLFENAVLVVLGALELGHDAALVHHQHPVLRADPESRPESMGRPT